MQKGLLKGDSGEAVLVGPGRRESYMSYHPEVKGDGGQRQIRSLWVTCNI